MKFDAELPVDSLFGLVGDRAGDDNPQAAVYAQLDALCNDLLRRIRSNSGLPEIASLAKAITEAAQNSADAPPPDTPPAPQAP